MVVPPIHPNLNMATDATTPPTPSAPSAGECRPCCSEKSLAYLLVRVLLGLMLLLAGVEKFKSADSPYAYSFSNWHDDVDSKSGQVIKYGRWWPIVKVVYESGGLNNPEAFQFGTFLDGVVVRDGKEVAIRGGERISNLLGWMFYYYGQVLPYLMLASGSMILLGFLNRIGLFMGGGVWLSLAAGQMILPDNPTVFMLSQYTLMVAVALALVKYNRFALTRF